MIPILGRSGIRRGGPAGRTYHWREESFPSVTSILSGGVPKPALLPWGIREVAEGAVALTLTGDLGTLADRDPAAAIQTLKDIPYSHRDAAANMGSHVHAVVEAHILRQPLPAVSPEIQPYVNQFLSFLAAEQPEYLAAECTVYSREYGYAGTLDAIVRIRGKTLLLDYKTGKAVYPEAALQLAAYRHAEFAGLPDGSETPLPQTDGAAVLHLQPDEWKLVPVRADRIVFGYFLHAKAVWRWQTSVGAEALKATWPTA